MRTTTKWLDRMFKPVTSPDDALKLIDEAAITCYIVAGISVLLAIISNAWSLVGAVLCAALGFWLQYWFSRIASALLLALGVSSIVMSQYTRGQGLIMGAVITFIAARACQATFMFAPAPRSGADQVEDDHGVPR